MEILHYGQCRLGVWPEFGVKVWFAPAILKIGDILSRSIDKGLANGR